jgi:hypothetical protein
MDKPFVISINDIFNKLENNQAFYKIDFYFYIYSNEVRDFIYTNPDGFEMFNKHIPD